MTSTTQPIIALAIKHGASSYTNRADTQHPAYGFTEAALTAFAQDLLAGQCLHQIAEPQTAASMLTFVNGKPAMCGCRFSYSDGGGEYSDVGSVTLCAKHAGTERNGIERAEPFMWAIQEPGGDAYMDDGCVSSVREDVQAEVDGLNSGLDADDDPYKVVPVYLAAAPQAVQAAVPEGWKLAPIKVPDSAFAWVSGGYPAGYKAGDNRDTAVVHERAQRAWEAILNGITAPAHPAEGVPEQAAPGMTAERASYFMRRFLKEEKLLGPNEQAAMHYVISLLAATQPAAQGMDALPMQASEGIEDVAIMEHPEWMLVHKETGAQKPLDSQWTVRAALPAAQGAATTGYIAPKGRYVPPVLFSPYTGEPRDARDIASDPRGILIVPPGAALAATQPAAQAVALQALRTIAEYPATDLMMNMDAANMRLIAEQALAAASPAAQGVDAIRALIAQHGKELERNHYAYFELAYTRRTGWMVWITDKPAFRESVLVNPDRKVLARGQGDTPEAACADALAAQAKQGGAA